MAEDDVVQATPDAAAEPSIEDTIRDTWRDIQSRGETPPDEPQQEQAPAEPVKEDRQRAPDGKFAKAETDTVAAPAADPAPVERTPNSWRKEAQEKWSTLDPVVKAEVLKREEDFHKGYEPLRQKAEFADRIQQTIAPYTATLQSMQATPEVAIQALLSADHALRYGTPAQKIGMFQKIARDYGIDIGQVGQMQQPAPMDPNIAALQEQVGQVTNYFARQQQEQQQRETQTVNSALAAFEADPKNSHFAAVRADMGNLIATVPEMEWQTRNVADILQRLYETAVWANPTTRALELAKQQETEREAARKKAENAKQQGSVNVRGRPAPPASKPIGTIEDTIREKARELGLVR
jgi:hypothetical protein